MFHKLILKKKWNERKEFCAWRLIPRLETNERRKRKRNYAEDKAHSKEKESEDEKR